MFGYVKKKMKDKTGVAIIQIVLLSFIIFPIILGAMIDSTSIYKVNKDLKLALDLATKSGVRTIDTSQVPTTGITYIDVTNAQINTVKVFADNMGFSTTGPTGGTPYDLTNISNPLIYGTPRLQVLINNSYYGTPQTYPLPTEISPYLMSAHNIGMSVAKPVVFAIARVMYQSTFGKKYVIVRWSEAQLDGNN